MDDGERSSLYVTFARGFPKGDNSTYPSGVPQTCGVGGIEQVFGTSIFARRHRVNSTFRVFFWFGFILGHLEAILTSS